MCASSASRGWLSSEELRLSTAAAAMEAAWSEDEKAAMTHGCNGRLARWLQADARLNAWQLPGRLLSAGCKMPADWHRGRLQPKQVLIQVPRSEAKA